GASLYFTVMARALPEPRDAIAQWQEAKAAASEAIVRHKGTITHHHAVGRHHAGDLEAEIGPVGLHVLRRTKAALDPAGILNPGVLTNPSNPV
ncbi:MAG TPA: FAD-linked oxidase C-terminal domain-containing protein, partial [Actinopolymorphaceae bacterium]